MKKRPKLWDEYDAEDARTMPVPNGQWKLKRTWKLQKCKVTSVLILPSTMAWCKRFRNAQNGLRLPDVWVTEEAYLFEKLKGSKRLTD